MALFANARHAGDLMLPSEKILAAIRADFPAFRIVIFPFVRLSMGDFARALMAAPDALPRLAGKLMLHSIDFFPAIRADRPAILVVVLPVAGSPLMGRNALARLAAIHTQTGFAGNPMLPGAVLCAAIRADLPMLRFRMLIIAQIMLDIARALMAAHQALPRLAGNNMGIPIGFLPAGLADMPAFRFGVFPIVPRIFMRERTLTRVAAVDAFSILTGDLMIPGLLRFAAIQADAPMLRFRMAPIAVIMSGIARAFLVAIDAPARFAGNPVVFLIAYFAAVLANKPMLRFIAFPGAPIIIVSDFALARTVAGPAEARFAGNPVLFTLFFTAILANMPMLRPAAFPGAPIIIVSDFALTRLAARPAQPRGTGNIVLQPFRFLAAVLANKPMLRFIAFPGAPIIIVGDFALARLAAGRAQARLAGNPVLFMLFFFTAILADEPMLRFIELYVRQIIFV